MSGSHGVGRGTWETVPLYIEFPPCQILCLIKPKINPKNCVSADMNKLSSILLILGTLQWQPLPNLLPIISQRPSDHDREPPQVNIQEIRIMHVVYILEMAAEIVFAFNRVTSCSPAVLAAICRTSVARPRLVDIVGMATKVFGTFERWYTAAKIALVRSSENG